MKRRTFFAGAAAAICGAGGWAVLTAKDEHVIEMVVKHRLSYLKLDPEGVRQFAADLAEKKIVSRRRMQMLRLIQPMYQSFELSAGENALAYRLRHGEERIVSAYLLSTDFFINNADESREVRYLGLWSNRRSPCGNPFARLML